MWKLFAQIWTAFTAFFYGLEKFANAFVSIATVAEDAANTFQQEEFLSNQNKIDKLKEQLNDNAELNEAFNKKFGDLSAEPVPKGKKH